MSILNIHNQNIYIQCNSWNVHLAKAIPVRRWDRKSGKYIAPLLDRNLKYIKAAYNRSEISDELMEMINAVADKPNGGFPSWHEFKMEPREYQMDALNKSWPHDSFALFMQMRTGKTFVSINLMAARAKAGLVNAVLVICPTSAKVVWKMEMEKHCPIPYELHVIQSGGKVKTDQFINKEFKDIKIMVVGVEALSLGTAYDKAIGFVAGHNTQVIVDECFTPDVEILTDRGFVRFDKLNKKDKVAQYDIETMAIDFVYPARYIDKPYDGEMFHLRGSVDISVTPNHDLIAGGKKVKASEFRRSYDEFMPISGVGCGREVVISDNEKAAIAILANSDVEGDPLKIRLDSNYKEILFESVMSNTLIQWFKSKTTEGDNVYTLYLPVDFPVEISGHFDLTGLHGVKANAIINEVIMWGNGAYIETDSINDVNFYQSLCAMGHVQSSVMESGGKYGVHININKWGIETTNIEITEADYSGNVFCVEVPKGNIVVRRHGKVTITGNSSSIKNPTSSRAKKSFQLGDIAAYRLILNGTPVTQGVEDLWPQFRMLDWAIIGQRSYYNFIHRYCEFGGFEGRKIIGYNHLSELMDKIGPYTYQISTKEAIGLPSRVNELSIVEPSVEQAKALKDLGDPLMVTQLDDDILEVETVLERMIRYQQIVGGHFPYDERDSSGHGIRPFTGKNPKMIELFRILDGLPNNEKVIIWARFKPELSLIEKLLMENYGEGCSSVYKGGMTDSEREQSLISFRDDPQCKYFVANQSSGGRAIDLASASVHIYYSNTFSLDDRMQSEMRTNSSLQKSTSILYVDIIMNHKIDMAISTSLTNKKEVADYVEGELSKRRNRNNH